MEQALKERLVGAVVLVGIAVLLIPELLSGRKPAVAADDTADGARTYTIELQPPVSSKRVDVASRPALPSAVRNPELTLPAPEDESRADAVDEPAAPRLPASSSDSAPSTSPGAAAQATPAAPPETIVDSREPPAPGGLAVQVGAFGSEDAAKRLVRELQAKGYDAYLSPVERGGKTLQRVRVGPARDAATAAATAERLKQQGYGSAVVVGT